MAGKTVPWMSRATLRFWWNEPTSGRLLPALVSAPTAGWAAPQATNCLKAGQVPVLVVRLGRGDFCCRLPSDVAGALGVWLTWRLWDTKGAEGRSRTHPCVEAGKGACQETDWMAIASAACALSGRRCVRAE